MLNFAYAMFNRSIGLFVMQVLVNKMNMLMCDVWTNFGVMYGHIIV